MRLIDANDLKKNFIGKKYGVKAIEYQIENAQTIDAVPIEWIKRYAKKGGRIANILFPFEIEMMLEDWEEENERV